MRLIDQFVLCISDTVQILLNYLFYLTLRRNGVVIYHTFIVSQQSLKSQMGCVWFPIIPWWSYSYPAHWQTFLPAPVWDAEEPFCIWLPHLSWSCRHLHVRLWETSFIGQIWIYVKAPETWALLVSGWENTTSSKCVRRWLFPQIPVIPKGVNSGVILLCGDCLIMPVGLSADWALPRGSDKGSIHTVVVLISRACYIRAVIYHNKSCSSQEYKRWDRVRPAHRLPCVWGGGAWPQLPYVCYMQVSQQQHQELYICAVCFGAWLHRPCLPVQCCIFGCVESLSRQHVYMA